MAKPAEHPRLVKGESGFPGKPRRKGAHKPRSGLTMQPIDVLFVEADTIDQLAFRRLVAENNLPYSCTMVNSIAEAKSRLHACKWDVVISAYELGDGIALDLVESLNGFPLVITTREGTEEIAKAAAYDYVIKDNSGNYLKLLPIAVEKATQQAKGHEYVRMLLHALMNISDSVYITDPSGVIRFANKAFCETYGYSEKEIVGKPARVLEGDSSSGECLHRRKDGTTFAVSLSHTVIKDDSGKDLSFVTVARDITERKNSEAALQASEERYRCFFDEDLAGDFIATPDGKLSACNRSFARIFGFSSVQEAMRYNLSALYGTPQAGAELMEMLRFNRRLEHHEMLFRRIDGQPVHVIQNIVGKFDAKGDLVEFKGYMFDNTQRKRLEDQLRQAQKMESIGTLAGGIAHDFNNILTIILGHASVLKDGTPELAAKAKSLETITTAVQRGASLVKQILTFARQEDVEVKPVSVNPLVEELSRMLYETFPKTISLTLDLAADLPQTVADQNQLHQVLLNLCVNARDAMPGGGRIAIATDVVPGPSLRRRYADALEDCYIRIRVTDTGEGIPEGIRTRVFEPFFTTKDVGKGTGLGLAVAYGVLKSHRGFIDVESEVGAGTTFMVYIPVVVPGRSDAVEQEKPQEELSDGKGTILLVEDEETLLDLVKCFLESKGYDVIPARDGEEAVTLYRGNKDRIRLVLTDLGLPRLDGWGAFLRMREINPKVKVVVASGYVDPDMRATMLRAGATELVQKPYLPLEILGRVKTLLSDTPEAIAN